MPKRAKDVVAIPLHSPWSNCGTAPQYVRARQIQQVAWDFAARTNDHWGGVHSLWTRRQLCTLPRAQRHS